jgi:hypothetical protein
VAQPLKSQGQAGSQAQGFLFIAAQPMIGVPINHGDMLFSPFDAGLPEAWASPSAIERFRIPPVVAALASLGLDESL